MKPNHESWMRVALEEAAVASVNGEIPVGAIVVAGDRIVGRGHNRSIGLSDPTAHAEVMALRDAGARIGNYRLPETIMYVTLEPCPMCAGALLHARVGNLVFGARDSEIGAAGSAMNLLESPLTNHRCQVIAGILETDCSERLEQFFALRRR
ncbi:MAG TPA: tRNA adenosine(34) deaminase TadA [Gammaproteobacteria bacterium]|nr:MAG: tRNA adenosine(34) deaminase TadA [Acidithiobacillus sp.]RTZ62840.1 MAG: tRNA adenosine(34) deaminase TadA [Gammaproteobacteria bacterium]HAD37562.1 tRNA adenosine(34) deaminase TadA [Gammaproteobacteria bacterium]HBK77146.1 tRNA adenosine(34) deaminase TadA [Gammaproteobacteria bacterium]HHZ72370.1 tRNA adenosine(34) deaminase TadA [Gammaproteobacteria bacterium]